MLIDNTIAGRIILLVIILQFTYLGLVAPLTFIIGTINWKNCRLEQIEVSYGIHGFNSILSVISVNKNGSKSNVGVM